MSYARDLYDEGFDLRNGYLQRARLCAKLTIPWLFPDEGQTGASLFETPQQADGGRCVNHASSKLALATFPPNVNAFRLRVDPTKPFKMEPALAQALGFQGPGPYRLLDNKKLLASVNEDTKAFESKIVLENEKCEIRVPVEESIRNVIVGGTVIQYQNEKTGFGRIYGLPQFTIDRDSAGNLLYICICEKLRYRTLPPAARAIVDDMRNPKKDQDPKAEYEVYTVVERDAEDDTDINTAKYTWYQECLEEPFTDEKHYTEKNLPYFVHDFQRVSGEVYGRSRIEQYLPSLLADEGLTQNMTDVAAMLSMLRWQVDPASGITTEEFLRATQGAALPIMGRESVRAIQAGIGGDLRIVGEYLQELRNMMFRDFMIFDTTDITRDRVTKEEILRLAQEANASLGGYFTHNSATLQRPLIEFQIERLRAKNEFLSLGTKDGSANDLLVLNIITGIDALGRGDDMERANQWSTVCSQALGPQEFAATLEPREFVSQIGDFAGIDVTMMVRSREEIDQREQAQQQQERLVAAAPSIVNQAGETMRNNQNGQTGSPMMPPPPQPAQTPVPSR